MVPPSKKIYELNHTRGIFELKNLNDVNIDAVKSIDTLKKELA